jgi:hypothetical protein
MWLVQGLSMQLTILKGRKMKEHNKKQNPMLWRWNAADKTNNF